MANGCAVTLWGDAARTARDLSAFSASDARRYQDFLASLSAITRVIRGLLDRPAPPIDDLRPSRHRRASGREPAVPRAGTRRRLSAVAIPADVGRRPGRGVVRKRAPESGDGGRRRARRAARAAVSRQCGGAAAARVAGWSSGGAGLAGARRHRQRRPERSCWRRRAAGADVRVDAGVSEDSRARRARRRRGVDERRRNRRSTRGVEPRSSTDADRPRRPAAPGSRIRRRVQNIRMRGVLAKVNYAVDAAAVNRGRRRGRDPDGIHSMLSGLRPTVHRDQPD